MEDSLEELVEKCTAQKVPVRLAAYRALVQKCTESDEVVWSDYASQDDTQKTLSNLKADLFNDNCDISYEAAGLCGCLLANETFRSLLTKENEGQALDMLIKAIGETKEKKVLTRTLWSLGKSRLSQEVYIERLKKILETINNVLKVEDGSAVAVLEALQVVESLLKLIPDEMNKETKEWFPNVFVFLFHDAMRVRMSAFACISVGRSFLITEDLKSDILKLIIPDLKAKHCKTMNRLIGAECTDVLKEWRLIVEILGKELHPGTSLINGLLEVVEKGFKSVKAEIRIEAFKCWQSLIDNFSLDEAVLTHSKRLKLLLAPLKANNAKTEDIALAKLLSWWHLVCKLGKKATSNFDLVIAPLLRFCFGCGAPASGAASGLSERNLIMSGAAASPGRKFSGLHVTCAEILGQILSAGLNISGLQPFSFTTPILEYPVIPNQVIFIRNYQFFMSCVKEAVQSLNSQERKQCLLGIFLFQSVLAHLRVVITTDVSKKDSVEPVKELFTMISAIESQCRPGDSQSQFVYKFLELVIVGSLGLPKTVLNSRQYHISTGNTMRDMMSGTLNNYLIHELCKPTLLHYATSREGYFTMWLEVLANSRPATGKLGLLQSVVKELDAAAPVLCPAHPNTLARLWSSVVNQLLQHIEETQVIDQGDGSEHDWSCIYSVLMFPLRHSIDALNSAESHVYHQIMKDWSELWQKFIELTPLATTAEPNSEVEYVTHALVSMCTEKLTAPPDVYASTYCLMSDVVAVLTDRIRYSELGKTSVRMVHSPAKPRKKPHALHNLSGSVALIGILLNRVLRMVSNQRQHAASRLCEALTQIFKGVQQEKIINSLVLHVVDTLAAALQVNPAAKFGVEVEKKFINMFKSFGSLLDEHFGKAISSDQFIKLVPLLTISLSSTNKHIKQEAKRIWRNNFSEIKQDIPSELFERLKECSLPPASLTDPHEDAEESLSLSPKENVPTHIAGSFLNREMGQEVMHKITPKGKSQKFETPKSLKASQGTPITKDKSKRKINLEDMNDEEFVKVSSPKTSRRVLTEHQIERMTERRSDIPALYSDLSQSMSQAVLPTQFSSQNSFEESSSVNTEKSREKKLDEAGQRAAKSMQEEREDDKKEEKEANIQNNAGDLSFSGLFQSENQEPEISKESEKKSERNTKAKFEKPKPKTKKKFQQEARAEEVDCIVTDKVEDTLKSRTVEESKDLSKAKADEEINGGESIKDQESSAKNNTKKGKGVKESLEDRKTRSKSKESSDSDEKSISRESESRESLTVVKREIMKPVNKAESKRKIDTKRRYMSGESDYTDEDLDEELRKTSIELQKSLDSMSSDSGDASVTEQNRRKSQTPVKKTVEDVRKSLKGKVQKNHTEEQVSNLPPLSPTTIHKRINFKEVAVSPSVVKDCKIVSQIPEVKLVNNAAVLHNRGKISDSESEEEIPNSQVEEPKQQLLVFSIINKEKEETPGKSTVGDRENNAGRGRRILRAKRKRGAVEDEKEEEEEVNPDKRKRVSESVSHSIGGKQSSSEDSVIIIDEKVSSDSSSEKKSDGGVEVKNSDKNIKRNKKTKSQLDTSRKNSQSSQNNEIVHDSEGLPSTPPKVTRSGRKVVAPNKDMPEPMTPPGSASQKRRSKSQESLSVSYVGDDVPKVTEKLNSTSPKDHVPSTRKSVQKKITDMFVKDDGDSQDVDKDENDSLPEMEDMDCDTVHPVSDSENDEVPLKSMSSAAPENIQEECDTGDNQEESVIEIEESKVSEELFETSCVEILKSEVNEKTSDNGENSEEEEVEVEHENEAKNSESGKPVDVDEYDDEETLDADEMCDVVKDKENDTDSKEEKMDYGKESSVDHQKDNQIENKESKDPEVEGENIDDSGKCDSKQNIAETAVESKEEEMEDSEKRDGQSVSEDPVNSFENGQALDEEIKEIDKEPTKKSNKDKDRVDVETLSENNSLPRQQEDELSPEKPVRSKLSAAVGTPERQKKFGALKCAGSRAAMLVACAKQNMKNRGTSDGDSPTKAVFGSDGTRNRLGGSPIRRSAPGRMSPASTPPNRKRKFGDSDGGRPWVKHEPSPGASPSTSILKKPALDDVCNDTPSPPPSKQRRVSFADPPVSDRVEIPPSPKTLRGLRAQKRLDMTKAASPMKDDESQSPSQNESQEGESQVSFDCSQPLYPSLVNCTENLDAIISQLTSAGLTDGLKKVLEDLGVTTVGQFCQLTEADVNKLPVRAPKVSSTLKVIKKYDETKSRESKKSTEPIMDEVEAQLSQIFAEDDREDKENQRPNNQAKVKKSIDEVSAVLMDDVIEDSLENMEPEEDNQIDADCSNDLPPRLGDEDLEVDDDVMPLDPSPDNAGEVSEPVSAVCRHITENPSAIEDLAERLDLEAKKTLFSSLLNKLRYPFVIDCYYEYLKNRESDTNT
ncbi:telomere-associated protein RIF1-like [Penaeus chinensis]|uniref:telomere-associated protein RIF1-like n=1 Tax=Penaeus chinensis TaxID=139456 RepID=UPI001FB5E114|nr:telomere-associated protein RIF1-like [Penaeus chinensis]XP_047486991.1 telomere-associated protein RIF1-like [Penaeus chinensis]